MMKLIAEAQEVIDQVPAVIIILRQPKLSAQLRQATALRPILSNVTLLSSTFAILDRYQTLRKHGNGIAAVEDALLHGSNHRRVTELHSTLKALDSVCTKLQSESATLASTWILFDGCIERHQWMAEYLRPVARIVHSPVFESAVLVLTPGRASMQPANFEMLIFL
ncbi:TPA: hypothetical protein N0F65_003768 [Lagenidium giganteum]|uniref:Uncharacterized protein n=1 Tax=Lagenidium giganteum TaxID=4803 RepID=A0AAV2YDE3_9STRA|nr:TPA: hypothetical protein N0F65_003768 [Lagenidium giganteum]